MEQDRWQRIEALFAGAIELPESQRSVFLARACGADAPLHAELRSLLTAHGTTTGPLDSPPEFGVDSTDGTPRLAAGTRIGTWAIGELIGHGGSGDVYLAHRADGAFEQQVAIKLLRPEAASQVARFNVERQILARLDHAGIARLLDGGLATDGRPYAVVEYVAGVPLIEHCRARSSNLEERLTLFSQVCEVVAYAHRNLIVHRDLKSGNILVTPEGRVKLLDFGIAKQLDPENWHQGDLTRAPFTPDYAAPEQLTGELVTTATDVYALGVLLFELLTDRRPWASAGMALSRMVRLIVHDVPPAPSRVARDRDAPPVAARLLQGDLDAIVAKCLRKEPAHRYATVDELRQDLVSHQQHMPVAARERVGMYVLGTFLRRYRWAVVAACLVFVSLAVGLATAIWQADQAGQQSRRAEAQTRIANAEATKAAFVKDFLLDIFNSNSRQQVDPLKAQNTTALQLLDRAAQRLISMKTSDPVTHDDLLNTVGSLYSEMGAIDTSVILFKSRLDLAKRSFARDDPRVIDALQKYGGALYDAEGWKNAMGPLSEADALLKSRNDLVSLDRARLDIRLGEYWRSTDLKQALFLVHRAVALFRDRYPNDPDYANALLGAGLAESDALHHNLSEQMYRLAVKTQERLGTPEAFRVQNIVMLADAQRSLWMEVPAEQNYRRGLEIARRINGPDHVDTLQTQLRYGGFLRVVSKFRQAIDMLRSAEALAVAKSGDNESFHLPTIRTDLGRALFLWGEPDAALKLSRRAISVREKTRPNTKQHANMLLAMAPQLTMLGRFKEADSALAQAEEISNKVGQPVLTSHLLLFRAENLLAQGAIEESIATIDTAEKAAQEAAVREPTAWRDKHLAQSLRIQRARAMIENTDFFAAAPLLQTPSLAIIGANEAAFFQMLEYERMVLLGRLYTHQRRADLAVPILRTALDWRRAHLSRKSPLVLQASVALAEALAEAGRIEDARRLVIDANAIARQHSQLGRQYLEPLRRAQKQAMLPNADLTKMRQIPEQLD